MDDATLQMLADKQEIHEVVLRYCRGADRLDIDLVRSAYHPDGVDHHTGFSGSVDDYIPWVHAALSRFTGTTHIIGNHLAEVSGDTAVVETYGQAVHWNDDDRDDPKRNFTSGFRYIDHMTRRDGVWKIQERWAARQWTRSDAGRLMQKEGVGPSGARDDSDPLFVLKRRLGI